MSKMTPPIPTAPHRARGAPVGNLGGDACRLFQSHDWWLYATDVTPFRFYGSNSFDLTVPAARNAYANFLSQRILASGVWDGLFLDDLCESQFWKEQFAGQQVDENRDHIHDVQSVSDSMWKVATDTLAGRLRQ